MQLHASCVMIDGCGVLLLGPPGSGKSDLALRLIDQPGYGVGDQLMRGELVGDDQIILSRRGDVLIASPAAALAGLLEIRGIGIAKCAHAPEALVRLVVELSSKDVIERLPDRESAVFEALGVSVPKIALDPSQPSAVARVRADLTALGRP